MINTIMFLKNRFGKTLNFNFVYKFLLKKLKIEFTVIYQNLGKKETRLKLCQKKDL